MMEILPKFAHTSRLDVTLDSVQNSFFTEIQSLYGDHALSYRTIARWTKKFGEGVESLEDNPRTGRQVSKTIKTAEATIHKLISTDARYTIRKLAKATGIRYPKLILFGKKTSSP